jgi:hypothetical protein
MACGFASIINTKSDTEVSLGRARLYDATLKEMNGLY